MCAAVYALGSVLPGGPWMKLVLQIGAGAVLYGGGAWVFKMESFTYLLRMVGRKRPG